jgi:hypothetical protein
MKDGNTGGVGILTSHPFDVHVPWRNDFELSAHDAQSNSRGFSVDFAMLALGYDLKVFVTIIRLIPVNVMNVLFVGEFSTKTLLNDKPVL